MRAVLFLFLCAAATFQTTEADRSRRKPTKATSLTDLEPKSDHQYTAEEVARIARSPSHQQWLNLISEYARDSMGQSSHGGKWTPQPFTADLPIGDGSNGKPSATLPVLILPVPVSDKDCKVNEEEYQFDIRNQPDQKSQYDQHSAKPQENSGKNQFAVSPQGLPSNNFNFGQYPSKFTYNKPQESNEKSNKYPYDIPQTPEEQPNYQYNRPQTPLKQPKNEYQRPQAPQEEPKNQYQRPQEPQEEPTNQYQRPQAPKGEPTNQYQRPQAPQDQPINQYQRPQTPQEEPTNQYQRPQTPQEEPTNQYQRPQAPQEEPTYPYETPEDLEDYPEVTFDVPVSSEYLVELFRSQSPRAPELPPAVIPNYGVPYVEPYYQQQQVLQQPQGFQKPSEGYHYPTPEPQDIPKPRVPRSLMLESELTVPRADYTEPYVAWFDSDTGAATVEFHGGATTTHRVALPDGSLQTIEMRIDRSGEQDVLRCGISPPMSASFAKHPALPDMELFSFTSNRDFEGSTVEVWSHTLAGGLGELGAARGEALTFRHELLLSRDQEKSMPVMYSVSVDSSVLGPATDGYQHRYRSTLRNGNQNQNIQALMQNCDTVEELKPERLEHLARLEPLREFTLPHRDTRYDIVFNNYKNNFNRKYVDEREEAVRKNIMMQSNRFVESCNREGATFETELNFLGDRLDAEIQTLCGVVLDEETLVAEHFPHSEEECRELERKMPKEFDWRPRGAVTSVRYQGSCSSCWAFAVVAATEGALFINTKKLVALSEQCLVDCAHKFGGNGCRGTWPAHAYDYIQTLGIPALNEYTAYKEKVLKCRDDQVPPTTHISAHVNVTRESIPALKVAVRKHAPTVAVVDGQAKSFIFYKKGVLQDERCQKNPPKNLNHAVTAVGWGVRKEEPHFIMKNSWSAGWGDGGYIRLHAPSNTCGHLSIPSYPKIQPKDVDKQLGQDEANVKELTEDKDENVKSK